MIIRKANSQDVSVLSGLIRDSFYDVAERFGITSENCPKHPSNCDDKWIEKDFERGVCYYILEHDGLFKGCVALEKGSPDLCYLERLSVLPEGQRGGVGRKLVEHAFSVAKTLRAKEISIGVIAGDKRLKGWYEKIGFVEEETKRYKHLPFLVTFMKYEL
ncbi:MAG: GNAT family N-acetyltransferase [Deltaproteobacteria bacterium]|nr:GNAT family N-acetyltransferase [Deltaproteobacteria bacterium]